MEHTIKTALLNTLKEIKRKGISQKFRIVFIGPGLSRKEILNCEEIQLLPMDGRDDSIRKRINLLRFSGRNVHALKNLRLVDSPYIYPKNLDRVLYFTDDMGISDEETIPAVHKAVPLNWKDKNIPLKVVTTGSLDVWKKQLYATGVRLDKNTCGSALRSFFKLN
jgi:hypothetical protein